MIPSYLYNWNPYTGKITYSWRITSDLLYNCYLNVCLNNQQRCCCHIYQHSYILSNLTLTPAHPQQNPLHHDPTPQVYSQEGPGGVCPEDVRAGPVVPIHSPAGWVQCVIVSRPRWLVQRQVHWRLYCCIHCWNDNIGISGCIICVIS